MSSGLVVLRDHRSSRGRWISAKNACRYAADQGRRPAIVLVPVAVVSAVSGVNAHALLTVAVATAVWSVALSASQRDPAPSALALGNSVVTAVGTITGLAAMSLLDFWFPALQLGVRQLMLMAGGVFLASWVLEAKLQRNTRQRRLVLVGADEGIRTVLDELAHQPELPFEVIGFVSDDLEGIAGVRRLGATRELGVIVEDERPDLVVLGTESSRADAVSQVLDLASLDVRIVDVHHFNEHAFGKVPVQHLSPTWFMGVLHLYQRPYSRVAKRAFDIVVATFALVMTAPLFLAVTVATRLSDDGPVYFRQLRLGEGGKLFEIRKFRTMIERAEEPGVAVWATQDDARVTRLGRILRHSRIDELPQLWNVLRGEMSIVGPRPERPEFLELLHDTVPFWDRRHLVKPGITGWAQVRRGYTADVSGTAEKLSYDLYYLKYRSLMFDVAIASRTLGTVLTGFGSR